MICSDFLSRQKHDNSNLHKIIPIFIQHARHFTFEVL